MTRFVGPLLGTAFLSAVFGVGLVPALAVLGVLYVLTNLIDGPDR